MLDPTLCTREHWLLMLKPTRTLYTHSASTIYRIYSVQFMGMLLLQSLVIFIRRISICNFKHLLELGLLLSLQNKDKINKFKLKLLIFRLLLSIVIDLDCLIRLWSQQELNKPSKTEMLLIIWPGAIYICTQSLWWWKGNYVCADMKV